MKPPYTPTTRPLDYYKPILSIMAHEAGALVMNRIANFPQAMTKAEVGRAMMDMVSRLLRELAADRLPSLTIEDSSGSNRPANGRPSLVLVPLDDRQIFANCAKTLLMNRVEDEFGLSLTVMQNGTPIAAAVWSPFRNVTAAIAPRRHPMRMCFISALEAQKKLLPKTLPPHMALTHTGSPAPRLVSAALTGSAAIHMQPVAGRDVMAGVFLARQAGLTVTDRLGQPINFEDPTVTFDGLLAATPELQKELLPCMAY